MSHFEVEFALYYIVALTPILFPVLTSYYRVHIVCKFNPILMGLSASGDARWSGDESSRLPLADTAQDRTRFLFNEYALLLEISRGK